VVGDSAQSPTSPTLDSVMFRLGTDPEDANGKRGGPVMFGDIARAVVKAATGTPFAFPLENVIHRTIAMGRTREIHQQIDSTCVALGSRL